MTETDARFDFGALLPGVGVFGGVRRFLELGNQLVQRGHRFVLYHPDGTSPGWLPFKGEVRPLAALRNVSHQALLCSDPILLQEFENARADLKLFYCVLARIQHEREIVRHPNWIVVANSSGIRERLQQKYRVRAEEAIGGINLDVFRPLDAMAEQRPERPFRILVYGRFSRKRKGAELVVRATENLARRLSRSRSRRGAEALSDAVQLVLFDHVGPGNEHDPRKGFRCQVQHEFHLNLSQLELAQLYRSCDVFVSAERRAGWNNTVAEAMACGLPVICTRSGTRDLAAHLETAWVARWRHAFFLTRGLVELQRDVPLRRRLRDSALERVSGYTWSRVADALESIIRRHSATPGPA